MNKKFAFNKKQKLPSQEAEYSVTMDSEHSNFGTDSNGERFFINRKRKFWFFNDDEVRFDVKGTHKMLEPKHDEDILVQMRNVDITYGSGSKAFRAVKNLNLNIYKGEVLGLVGESGSGKSTTGKALVGLIPYSFGEIKLLDQTLPQKTNKRGLKFGKKLREYKKIEKFLVNKVQMIFQDPANSLNPHINVEKVVSEGLENTKNSKEIYLYNIFQDVIKETYKLITPEGLKHTFNKKMYNKLNATIAVDPQESRNFLYTDFAELLKTHKEDRALEYLLNSKDRLDEEFSKSENECKRIIVADILKSVGLDDSVLRRYPLEFSGGQQQRIGISRAVVLRPQLLVADEPISALDVSIQAQVVNIFNELKEKFDLTILFIAHDLRMVEYISDRIAVMNKGTLLEVGKTDEIMKNPIHPYTKSLLDAVPSIDSDKGSLIGYKYDARMHKYTSKNQPEWIEINQDHYVLATKEEIENWTKGSY